MAIIITPPMKHTEVTLESIRLPQVFLAGSIEQGKAVPWQDRVIEAFHSTNAVILNPRRDDWDDTWVQHKDNKQFRGQVDWELEGLENANIVLFYFDPATTSPITLLELGMCAQITRHHGAVRVCCPDGFFRKGNVDIVCDRYGLKQVGTLEELIVAGLHAAAQHFQLYTDELRKLGVDV